MHRMTPLLAVGWPAKRPRALTRKPRTNLERLHIWIVEKENVGPNERTVTEKKDKAADPTQPNKQKKKKQRVIVDSHNVTFQTKETPENEYELERLERIKRNAEVLKSLGVQQAAVDLQITVQNNYTTSTAPRPFKKQRRAEPTTPVELQPSRVSRRLAGRSATVNVSEELPLQDDDEASCPAGNIAQDGLLTQQEYFKLLGKELPGFEVDGRFHGWVNPAVCEQYGIANDADSAWELNGGGKFTFKIDRKAIPAHLKAKGWSDARAFAATQLRKNPNSYFYRHVAPHQVQAQGEWTQEEHKLFLDTADKHGVGDKWGLFASYIPQRVGYQCSAYYREVVIPLGLVADPRFKLTQGGKAVFIG